MISDSRNATELTVIHLNSQGFRKKLTLLESLGKSQRVDVFCLQEHWCKAGQAPELEGYKCFFSHREGLGGGTAICQVDPKTW